MLELDEPQMCRWAEALGARLRGGDVVLLRGEMGAGKTTFVRALARGLAIARPERVCSPTYTICMIHPGPIELVHVDLFRLGEEGPIGDAAFESLGLEHDELPGPDRVLVVEWSELWREPPAQHLELTLARVPGRPEVRRLSACSRGVRWDRDAAVWAGIASPGP
jgi:tRNA threonylcarbamoyladenosine biosynthesis protein TsaE